MVVNVPKTKSKQEKGNDAVRIVPEQINEEKNMIRKNRLSMILLFLCYGILFLTACNSNDTSTSDTKESKEE